MRPLERSADPRFWRLFDLAEDETIVVRCFCHHSIVSYGPGALQKQRRLPSDMLIYDLQYRLRCHSCGRTSGFEISVVKLRTDRSQQSDEWEAEIVIMPGL
jgi:hypothetical protein